MKHCPDCPSCYLKEIPNDVYDIILEKQFVEKKKRKNINGKSIEKVIYMIIKEWRDLTSTGAVIRSGGFDINVVNTLTSEQRLHIINEINKRVV